MGPKRQLLSSSIANSFFLFNFWFACHTLTSRKKHTLLVDFRTEPFASFGEGCRLGKDRAQRIKGKQYALFPSQCF